MTRRAAPGNPTEAPASPDEVVQAPQVRRFLTLLAPAAILFATLDLGAALVWGDLRAALAGATIGAYGLWLLGSLRARVGRAPLGLVVSRVAVGLTGVILIVAYLEPTLAPAGATAALIPIAVALPYVGARRLRQLMLLAWGVAVAATAASLLPGQRALPPLAANLVTLVGLTLASGLVLFLLAQSTTRLQRSATEFDRLSQMSADLAAAVGDRSLGARIAGHLVEATGFEEGIVYLLDASGERLIPSGSSTDGLAVLPQALAGWAARRTALAEQRPLHLDAHDPGTDPVEVTALQAAGRRSVLLVPLVTEGRAVGLVELRARGPRDVDARTLALMRTLATEAATALENRHLYDQLRHQALHDPLTGLANRALLLDRLEHALSRLARRPGALVAALYVDLDDFKAVNDRYGHDAGDRLLSAIADRLRGVVRSGDTVARLGGDEFVVLLDDPESPEDVAHVAGRIVKSLAQPVALRAGGATVGASVGIALTQDKTDAADLLLRQADLAMYAAKHAGKGRWMLYHLGLEDLLAAEWAVRSDGAGRGRGLRADDAARPSEDAPQGRKPAPANGSASETAS